MTNKTEGHILCTYDEFVPLTDCINTSMDKHRHCVKFGCYNHCYSSLVDPICNSCKAPKSAKKVENLHYIVSDLWQDEFFDIIQVLEMGARKHGKSNWLNKDGNKADHKSMHDSMFHHLAESFIGSRVVNGNELSYRADKESGLDPLLHLACRALMSYVRKKRGLDT